MPADLYLSIFVFYHPVLAVLLFLFNKWINVTMIYVISIKANTKISLAFIDVNYYTLLFISFQCNYDFDFSMFSV